MEHQKQLLKEAIGSLTADQLRSDQNALVSTLVNEYAINIPVIKEDQISMSQKDAQFEIHEPFYMHGGFGNPTVQGLEITIHVPFEGDDLFGVQPMTYTTNPPRGEVVNSEIQVIHQVRHTDTDVKARYEETLRQIKQHLDWMRPSASQLRQELEQLARTLVARQEQQHQSKADLVASLGLPERRPAQPSVHQSDAVKSKSSSGSGVRQERWDVFISHASEDKDEIAKPLSEALRAKGLSVWYDEFSLTLGDSLRQSIDRGLAQSRFGIVILSKHFFEKHWPQQELNGLATREVGGTKVILPIWHNISVEDVRLVSPTLADRVAVKSDKGLKHLVDRVLEAISRPC